MLTVPASFSQAFESQLSQRNIPDQQGFDFHKWLRFHLDFCAKYTLDPKLYTHTVPSVKIKEAKSPLDF